MFKFQTIKDFINALNRNKKPLTELFNKRSISLRYNDFVNSLEEQEILELDKLIDGNLINVEAGIVSLEEELSDFFEKFLDVRSTINTGMVQDIINGIRQNEAYYLEENVFQKKERYLKDIKKGLKKIEQVLMSQVRVLWESMEQVYKTETNLKIKLSKLQNFREKRDTIEQLVFQLEEIISTGTLFNSLIDGEFKVIVLKVRQALMDTKRNLLGVQENIIKYLAKVQEQSAAYEKLQRIKYLKDQYDLRAKSNIDEILGNQNTLFFAGRVGIKTRLSLSYLQTDEGYRAIQKVYQKQEKRNQTPLKLAKPIPQDFFELKDTEQEIFIDIEKLKNIYIAQGGDLFEFVQDFEFDQSITEAKRLTLFCKLISMYGEVLDISDTMQSTNDGIEYATVNLKRL
jgi:hypothetical protein